MNIYIKLIMEINLFKKIYNFLNHIGINLIKIFNLIYIFKFLKDLSSFKKKGGKVSNFNIILGHHKLLSGKIDKHYFHQDIHVASLIYNSNPNKHVDIGSRIDGFVSNLASFRKVEVLDIRENKIFHKNIDFKKMDLNSLPREYYNYSDSVSCLHTLEHLGLGRYGDNINPDGHIEGFKNLINITKPNGTLYVSFPISNMSRVEFNAHRVFEVNEILKWSSKIKIFKFDYINDYGNLREDIKLEKLISEKIKYGCGIYSIKVIK